MADGDRYSEELTAAARERFPGLEAAAVMWPAGLEETANANALEYASRGTAGNFTGGVASGRLTDHNAFVVAGDRVEVVAVRQRRKGLLRGRIVPELGEVVASWPRDQVSVSVGEAQTVNTLGYRTSVLPVTVTAPGGTHELRIADCPRDREFLDRLRS